MCVLARDQIASICLIPTVFSQETVRAIRIRERGSDVGVISGCLYVTKLSVFCRVQLTFAPFFI